MHFLKPYTHISSTFLGLKQEGEECGSCFCPPTYNAGNCAPGLECKHLHRDTPDAPGTCVRPGVILFFHCYHMDVFKLSYNISVQTKSTIESCSLLVKPSRKVCPSGYAKKKGDVPGWGSDIGSRLDLTLEQCAKRCSNEISCLSFEHSFSKKKCNLNKISEPTQEPNADFIFCTKTGSINDFSKQYFHGEIGL